MLFCINLSVHSCKYNSLTFYLLSPAVAYINYDKASSAAMAIENLHETILNDGKGPMVKVMFAEAPKSGQG